ncbi:MAG: phosphoribosyltransferase [Legionellales bacterium]|nr:MAG: phosphoribosyltransferase [Legionellales bacterium]
MCLILDIEHIICARCMGSPPAFDRLCSIFTYNEPVLSLVTDLKFNNKLVAGKLLGQLLADKVINDWYENDSLVTAIIPVPLHLKRLKQRGYNQVVEILHPVTTTLKLPVLLDACVRVKNTQAQSSLDSTARVANIADAFEIVAPIPYTHVALVDDVVTTGSTVNALSKILKQHGVEQVDVWCVCRA